MKKSIMLEILLTQFREEIESDLNELLEDIGITENVLEDINILMKIREYKAQLRIIDNLMTNVRIKMIFNEEVNEQ